MKLVALAKFVAAFAATRRRHFRDRAHLAAWQDRAVAKHLARLDAVMPVIRRQAEGRPLAAWRQFAVADKAFYLAHFREQNRFGIEASAARNATLAVPPVPLQNAAEAKGQAPFVSASSGTSGMPGFSIVSRAEQMQWAAAFLARILPSPLLQKHRVAFFFRPNARLYRAATNKWLAIRHFDQALPLSGHFAALEALRPTAVVAPSRLLRLIAEAKLAGELTIAPQHLYAAAEVLEPVDREVITRAFGVVVREIYQCTEGFLGASCAFGTLHLNEDHLVFEREYVDAEKTRFIPVITDFRRTTQVFLRYRMGDVLRLRRDPCPCGSVLTAVDAIEGRADDDLVLALRAGGEIVLPPDEIRRIFLRQAPELKDYQLDQSAPSRATLALEIEGHSAHVVAALREEIRIACERLGAQPLELDVRTAVLLDFGARIAGKSRRIRRNFSRPIAAVPPSFREGLQKAPIQQSAGPR